MREGVREGGREGVMTKLQHESADMQIMGRPYVAVTLQLYNSIFTFPRGEYTGIAIVCVLVTIPAAFGLVYSAAVHYTMCIFTCDSLIWSECHSSCTYTSIKEKAKLLPVSGEGRGLMTVSPYKHVNEVIIAQTIVDRHAWCNMCIPVQC